MQVIIESRDPNAVALRDRSEQRLRFVLRRLSVLVPQARVYLSDVNGPRGGVDKRCQIALRTRGSGTVLVTSVADDWRAAIDGAVARAARLLTRVRHRAGTFRRRTHRGESADDWAPPPAVSPDAGEEPRR